MFVNKPVFVSEQITGHMLGTLLEISDNIEVSGKLNCF